MWVFFCVGIFFVRVFFCARFFCARFFAHGFFAHVFLWAFFFARVLSQFIFNIYLARFDYPCIFPAMVQALMEKGDGLPDVIKKGSGYFTIRTHRFQFLDTLHFSSPCNYKSYLAQWKIEEVKSVFPYQKYRSVEQLKLDTAFPTHAEFYSNLTKSNIAVEDYENSKAEFERGRSLPAGHPNKMKNMACWLKAYNLKDVQPLVFAMERSFECFHKYFDQDPNCFVSLPGMAASALYRNYDQRCSYIYSFRQADADIRQMHREGINGGLVNLMHRHINLANDEGPDASRFSGNNEPYTYFTQLDFNALYGAMQAKLLPTTPGIRWTRKGGMFQKSVMADGVSYVSLQWLYYIQASATFLTALDGTRSVIHHKYHQGEVTLDGDQVDGYAKVDEKVYILEFLGCYHHGCICQDELARNAQKRSQWEKKRTRLEKYGTLITCWECEWDSFKSLNCKVSNIVTHFPMILQRRATESTLINAIRRREFFGFILCDLFCPDDVIEKLKWINFPPIIAKKHITLENLSHYMRKRYDDEKRGLDQMSLVQTYHGENLLVFSELIIFYLELGYEVKNIRMATQYVGEKCLAPFIDKVVKMRIRATYDNDETKANTAKILGNARYLKYLFYYSRDV